MLGDDDSGPPEPNHDWDLECGAQLCLKTGSQLSWIYEKAHHSARYLCLKAKAVIRQATNVMARATLRDLLSKSKASEGEDRFDTKLWLLD